MAIAGPIGQCSRLPVCKAIAYGLVVAGGKDWRRAQNWTKKLKGDVVHACARVCAWWWCHMMWVSGCKKSIYNWWTDGHGLSLSLSLSCGLWLSWRCRFVVAACCLNWIRCAECVCVCVSYVCRAECRPCFLSLVTDSPQNRLVNRRCYSVNTWYNYKLSPCQKPKPSAAKFFFYRRLVAREVLDKAWLITWWFERAYYCIDGFGVMYTDDSSDAL